MNIVLFGYRGSGKTTIGRKLADQLWKDFVDVDQEACRRFGIDSIAEIWQQHGEAAWRDMEVRVVQDLMQRDEQVIALGGGTLMQPAARTAVEQAEHARRIYLSCEPAELHQRIQKDPDTSATRPNLTKLGGGVEEIRAMLDERQPVYRAVADAELEVTHLSPDAAVRYLVRRHL